MEFLRHYKFYQKLRVTTARNYYIHGLFVASHPYSLICLVFVVVFLSCYPLQMLPFPGYAPLEYVMPINEFVVTVNADHGGNMSQKSQSVHFGDAPDMPEWLTANAQPNFYVQQIVVSARIDPWSEDLIPVDAIRKPLSLVFDMLDEINNFTFKNDRGVALRDSCFMADTVLRKYRSYGYLSEHDCLLISPANIWDLDLAKYQGDSDILGTVFCHDKRTTIDSSPGFKDLAFGIPWKETGIKTRLQKTRNRVIGFAVTIILKEYDRGFINALAGHLRSRFSTDLNPTEKPVNHILNIHFQTFPEIVQFLPLILTYVVVLLYLCFSVSKLEMVKSKIGLAISAVITILASMAMSAGLCTQFGLSSSLNGGEIFPYLVVIIGLENVIVITRSVVSTPVHLDKKYRIAQGLSREGWGITKNFVTECAVLLLGYMTYVPAIQEFCTFGFVGLLSDMFLQLVFFSAVLSIDIGRMELSDHISNRQFSSGFADASTDTDKVVLHEFPEVHCPVLAWLARIPAVSSEPASESANWRPGTDQYLTAAQLLKLPRRLRILWFFGSRRVLQRALMMMVLAWIGVLAYQSDLLSKVVSPSYSWNSSYLLSLPQTIPEVNRLDYAQKLSYRHWPTLFGYYNISLAGKFISVLPPISITSVISPADAIASRHPLDHKKTPWNDDYIYQQKEYIRGKLDEQDKWVLVVLGVSIGIVIIGIVLHAVRVLWPAKERLLSTYRTTDSKSASKHFLAEVTVYDLAEHLLNVQTMIVDQDRIATSCRAGQLRLWNWNVRQAVFSVKRMRSASEQGGFLSSSGNFVKDFILLEGRQIRALAMNRELIVAGCVDGALEVYNAGDVSAVGLISPCNVPVSSLALKLMDGHRSTIVAGRESGDLNVYSSRAAGVFELSYAVKLHHAPVWRILTVNDRLITVGKDNSVKILHFDDFICLHTLWNPVSPVTAFAVDTLTLTTAVGYGDGRVRLWSLTTGASINEYVCLLSCAVRSVCLSDDFIIALYVGGKIARWCRREGNPTTIISLGNVETSNLCLRDGFVFVGYVGEIRVFDCGTMDMVKVVSLDGGIPDYISCPKDFFCLENDDVICDYGRKVRLLTFREIRKAL